MNIRASKRIRGYTPRNIIIENIIIIKIIENKKPFIFPQNMITWIHLINKIIKFSPKKIREKKAPPYSTLNPETNSLSLSERSNGLRLTSTTKIIYINKPIGKKYINETMYFWENCISKILNLPNPKINKITKNPKITSYEIDWLIERTLPNKEYFEFEDHPLNITP